MGMIEFLYSFQGRQQRTCCLLNRTESQMSSINKQLIKGLNIITDRKALKQYTDSSLVQHFIEPMKNVVVRTEYFRPQASIEAPFRKNPQPCLEFTYTLSGDTTLTIKNGPGNWSKYHFSGGVRFFGLNTELSGIAAVNTLAPVKVLHLYITPQKLAQLLGSGSGHLVRAIIDKASVNSKSPLNITTAGPVTTSIIHQIFNRGGASPADSLFLKGKILELLSHEVEFLCGPQRKQTILQPDDVVMLQAAKTIIMERMSTPPSIAELARKVGLNEKKIKQGFKELYGTTVYGFLRKYRMEQAKLLFDRDQKSVTDVACAVGYSNVSHFGAIFRHHHGVRPGEYLKSQKEYRMTHHLPL